MRAVTVEPGRAGSVQVQEVDDPRPGSDELLVKGRLLGICGTDRELDGGGYGWAPPGRTRLILGHESLGEVISAPDGSDFAAGDLVVGVVRRPDPVPCGACAHGQFDMCRNGRYTERGIKEIDGFGSEQWVTDPAFAVRLDPDLGQAGVLMEPSSVVAKLWAQIEAIGSRAWFEPTRVAIGGSGPIGLLAALLGRQRGLDVHVVDVVSDGPKPQLVADLGATYHHDPFSDVLEHLKPDITIDTTGVAALLTAAMTQVRPYGIVGLLGMHDPQVTDDLDPATTGKNVVLNNAAIVGSVNANVDHWQAAADALAAADHDWLRSLLTRTVPLSRAREALQGQDGDVKVVVDLQA